MSAAERSVQNGAHVARFYRNTTFRAEGICSVCGLVTPVRIYPTRDVVVDHYPNDPRYSYDQRPSHFCRGSNHPPTSLFDGDPIARVVISSANLAAFMDGLAEEVGDHRVSVLAVVWDKDVSREDVHTQSRAWATQLGQMSSISVARLRVYSNVSGTMERE